MDKVGHLYFVDRVRDSLRRRGENISSMDVEDVGNQHSAVKECAVIPMWAEESEQEVIVSIVTRPGTGFNPVAL